MDALVPAGVKSADHSRRAGAVDEPRSCLPPGVPVRRAAALPLADPQTTRATVGLNREHPLREQPCRYLEPAANERTLDGASPPESAQRRIKTG